MPITWKAPFLITAPRPSRSNYLFLLPEGFLLCLPLSEFVHIAGGLSTVTWLLLCLAAPAAVVQSPPASFHTGTTFLHLFPKASGIQSGCLYQMLIEESWVMERSLRAALERASTWMYLTVTRGGYALSGILVPTIKIVICFPLLVKKKMRLWTENIYGNSNHICLLWLMGLPRSLFWSRGWVPQEGSALLTVVAQGGPS